MYGGLRGFDWGLFCQLLKLGWKGIHSISRASALQAILQIKLMSSETQERNLNGRSLLL